MKKLVSISVVAALVAVFSYGSVLAMSQEQEDFFIENNIIYYRPDGGCPRLSSADSSIGSSDNQTIVISLLTDLLNSDGIDNPDKTKIVVAAIAGNMANESGFNPNGLNRKDCNSTSCFASYGLVQWRAGRLRGLLESVGTAERYAGDLTEDGWKSAEGPKVPIEKQIEYLHKELKTSRKTALTKMLEAIEQASSKDQAVENAAIAFGIHFEGFDGATEPLNTSRINRIRDAKKFYQSDKYSTNFGYGGYCSRSTISSFNNSEVIIRSTSDYNNYSINSNKFVRLLQINSSWSSKYFMGGNYARYGCTATSAAMVHTNLRGEFIAPTYFVKDGFNIRNALLKDGLFKIKQHYIKDENIATVKSNIERTLSNQGLVLLYLRANQNGLDMPFNRVNSRGGLTQHAVVIRGIKDGKWLIADPIERALNKNRLCKTGGICDPDYILNNISLTFPNTYYEVTKK